MATLKNGEPRIDGHVGLGESTWITVGNLKICIEESNGREAWLGIYDEETDVESGTTIARLRIAYGDGPNGTGPYVIEEGDEYAPVTVGPVANNVGRDGVPKYSVITPFTEWTPEYAPIKAPDVETLAGWMQDGYMEAACVHNCSVEPDGTCEHGKKSWMLEMGWI